MKTVSEILAKKGSEVVGLQAGDTLAQAVSKLTQYKIGALLVLDGKGGIRGILSERDIIKHMAGKVSVSTDTPVSELMTKGVTYVKPHQSVDECLQLMTTGRFRHLPVVEEEKLIGIVSIGDMMKAVLEDRALQIGELEYYITNSY
jgi:CBS domain-containing protein